MSTPRIPKMSCLARSVQRSSLSRPATQGRRFINITTPHVEANALPESMITTPLHTKPPTSSPSATPHSLRTASKTRPSHSPRYALSNTPLAPSTITTPTPTSSSEPGPSSSILPSTPLDLPQSVRENLPYLVSQPPYYITIHIYGKPYLVTAGDTIRLPFLMDGVMPGDVLRLNRATLLGSRDWTLKGGATNTTSSATITASSPTDREPIMGNTSGLDTKTPGVGAGGVAEQKTANRSHKAPKYLDERLFTCRAVVMGTESEPMRVMEKTKQRQRHTKTVRSKHKHTILKVREIEVTNVEV